MAGEQLLYAGLAVFRKTLRERIGTITDLLQDTLQQVRQFAAKLDGLPAGLPAVAPTLVELARANEALEGAVKALERVGGEK